ncbi:hypothetical protein PCC7424_1827 [Gloeothece citriformis PCC 7424]|uniref:Uncharacterized protein n=1 Tax=Gloeothece citriformis (strain PCC 7424) TaxID=65393 RepID=B7KCF4_GLOC7|nr:hypothetical protein PCC7424_1827 [Gloeothece citriformis PCC 7424]
MGSVGQTPTGVEMISRFSTLDRYGVGFRSSTQPTFILYRAVLTEFLTHIIPRQISSTY